MFGVLETLAPFLRATFFTEHLQWLLLSTEYVNIYLFSIFFSTDFVRWKSVWLPHTLLISTFFFDWDSLHARLNSHYKAWSYKKGSTKKITGWRKSVYKEPTVKRCLLILDLKPLRSYVKGKHSIGREYQSLAVQEKNCWHRHPCNIYEWSEKNHAIYQNNE